MLDNAAVVEKALVEKGVILLNEITRNSDIVEAGPTWCYAVCLLQNREHRESCSRMRNYEMGHKQVVRKRKHESAKDQPKDQTQKKMNKTMMTEQTPKVAEVSIQATEPLKKIKLRVKGLKGGKVKKVTSDEVNNEDGLESQADETMEDDERKHESVEDRVKVPKGGKAKKVTSDEANNEDGLESEVVEPTAQADERMEDDERKHESVEDCGRPGEGSITEEN